MIPKPNDKVQSGTQATPVPKERMSNLKIKSMLICVFDSQGVVHNEFVPQGQLINSTIVRSLNNSEKEFIVSGQR